MRAVCLKPTDGLTRGTAVRNTGRGISVPVGDRTLGHVWNVIQPQKPVFFLTSFSTVSGTFVVNSTCMPLGSCM